MATLHIEAEKGDIAKTVIMSGDPLRAKFIAKKYLKDFKVVNKVRNMLFYTGYYNDKLVTIGSHGIGMNGAGLYFYELYKFYDVDNIIRIGTAGTSDPDINFLDTVLVERSYTESNFSYLFNKEDCHLEYSSCALNQKLEKSANKLGINLIKGTAMTVSFFEGYIDWQTIMNRVPKGIDVICTEMESFALFNIARTLNKKAACLVTISDSKVKESTVTREDREKNLIDMIEVALNSL